MRLFLSDGSMLYAARHNEELAFFHPHFPVPEFDPQSAMNHQKQFVFVLVVDRVSLRRSGRVISIFVGTMV